MNLTNLPTSDRNSQSFFVCLAQSYFKFEIVMRLRYATN
jgi:hypothetical protein